MQYHIIISLYRTHIIFFIYTSRNNNFFQTRHVTRYYYKKNPSSLITNSIDYSLLNISVVANKNLLSIRSRHDETSITMLQINPPSSTQTLLNDE